MTRRTVRRAGRKLSMGSMCTGYGGLDAGVMSVLGGQLAWTADNDPGAAAVIAHRMPDVPNLGDIRTAAWENVQPVDVMCAGFPCQPVSAAGKQKGTADERWLWPWISAAISRMPARPGLLVLENVPRLLTIEGGAAISQIIRSLAELGYVGCYGIYSAAEAGAPHLRKRWFLAAADAQGVGRPARGSAADRHRPDTGDQQAFPDTDSLRRVIRRTADITGSLGAATPQIRRNQAQYHGEFNQGFNPAAWSPFPDTDNREGRRGQQIRRPERRVTVSRGDQASFPDPGSPGLRRNIAARHGDEPVGQRQAPDGTAGGPAVSGTALDWQEYEPAVRRWELITGIPAPYPAEPGKNGKSRMTAQFPEWMMGLPPGWVTGVPGLSRSARIRVIGNGVVPHQAAMATASLLSILRSRP